MIVDIRRDFLNTNGAPSYTKVKVAAPSDARPVSIPEAIEGKELADGMKEILSDLNVCSQKGLVEMFDSSIGASTVLMPYGGRPADAHSGYGGEDSRGEWRDDHRFDDGLRV